MKGKLVYYSEKLTCFLAEFKEKSKKFLSTQSEKLRSFLEEHELTAPEVGATVGSFTAIALILALTVAVSPGNAGTPELPGPDGGADFLAEGDVSEETADAIQAGDLLAGEVSAIVANGKDIIYMASDEDAQAVLDGITEKYRTPGSEIISIGFKEDVSVVQKDPGGPVPAFSVIDAVNYIVTGAAEPKVYTVQGGDNLWDIAIANGVSPYEIQEMNPGLDPKKVSIGQEIYLYKQQPFITVSFTEVVKNEERIEYGVAYEDSASLYRGQTQVKSAGSYGSKEVTSEIIRENGVVVATTVTSEVVLTEPVTQVALRGTQALPVYTGSGSGQLSNPLAHMEVSSSFGSRGGGRHYGVDLRVPKGTPIYAAEDGVVFMSQYSGSLGNVVKVSHGDGLDTWYAHCDALLVSVGETVTKGQQIATIGATGNATGYILHFEVRINGVAQNPMNYL